MNPDSHYRAGPAQPRNFISIWTIDPKPYKAEGGVAWNERPGNAMTLPEKVELV
jgi:hypothetical protein